MANVKAVDRLGVRILSGDTVTYACRKGSRLWLKTGVVKKVTKEDDLREFSYTPKPCVTVDLGNGKCVKLFRIDNITVSAGENFIFPKD